MRILNFTIPHLKPLLLSGQKQQTIRGKDYWFNLFHTGALNIGDDIQIWFNQRSPSLGEKLFIARITGYRVILNLEEEPESLFIADGFTSKQEGLTWFQKIYGHLNGVFSLIQFKKGAPP